MALTTNFLIPIIKGVFTFGFILLFIYGIYKIIRVNFLTNKKILWIKFHIFKKNYPEEEVAWCMRALEKGWSDPAKIRKFLLLNSKFTLKKVEEILFIFSELQVMKGGVTNGRIRQNSGETEFPKISEEKNSKA